MLEGGVRIQKTQDFYKSTSNRPDLELQDVPVTSTIKYEIVSFITQRTNHLLICVAAVSVYHFKIFMAQFFSLKVDNDMVSKVSMKKGGLSLKLKNYDISIENSYGVFMNAP